MARTRIKIISEVEKEQYLSEKVLIRGGVTLVLLMSSSSFAAKNSPFMTRKVF